MGRKTRHLKLYRLHRRARDGKTHKAPPYLYGTAQEDGQGTYDSTRLARQENGQEGAKPGGAPY